MEPIKLTSDQKATAIKAIQDMWSALKDMYEWINKNSLYPDMREAVPQNLEHRLSNLCRAVGYDSNTEAKIKERHADLKKANMRIHELEKQMGEQGDINIVPQVLKVLREKVSDFWSREGFGHVSELSFTDYGYCKIIFSGMLFPDRWSSTFSETPETDKITAAQWIQNLKNRGFELAKESDESRREEYVIDNEYNRKLIIKTIMGRFPTAKITEFRSHLGYKCKDVFHLRDISVMIYNLAEIMENEKDHSQTTPKSSAQEFGPSSAHRGAGKP